MKQAYRRWACGLLAALCLLLAASAAVVYTVDPCLYYRIPTRWQPVFFSERTQAAGLVRNVPAKTVLMGTSMAANYRGTEVGEYLGGPAVRVTIPDGYFSEFDRVMGALFRAQKPERIVFGLDLNILVRDGSGVTRAMPEHLYNANPLDDLKYLLSKDSLYYCGYVFAANGWGTATTVDEGFTWDKGVWWNHMEALNEYHRPDPVSEPVAADAYLANLNDNLDVVCRWVKEHPDTEFTFFFPPYSILFWDKVARLGQTEAMLTALDAAVERLLPYENVRLFGFLLDRELVENLDEYCDYVHHSGAVCTAVLQKLAAGEMELTAENWHQTLANWQEFVVHYDYEKFWEEAFWLRWNDIKTNGGDPMSILSENS